MNSILYLQSKKMKALVKSVKENKELDIQGKMNEINKLIAIEQKEREKQREYVIFYSAVSILSNMLSLEEDDLIDKISLWLTPDEVKAIKKIGKKRQ